MGGERVVRPVEGLGETAGEEGGGGRGSFLIGPGPGSGGGGMVAMDVELGQRSLQL